MANEVAERKTFPILLEEKKADFGLVLPAHIPLDRFVRIALSEWGKSDDMKACTFTSILSSLMQAAKMGLEPGVNGQCYLIPYKVSGVMTCTLVPGWKGYVQLVRRAGAGVLTGAVYEGDRFHYELGTRSYIKHNPADDYNPDAPLKFVYAIGETGQGHTRPVIEVWSEAKCRAHFQKFNKVGARHYANQHWEMYARKLPLLQVVKYLPTSVELGEALAADVAAEDYASDGPVIRTNGRGGVGVQALREHLADQAAGSDPAERYGTEAPEPREPGSDDD